MEKVEYWALLWGTVIMSVTGLVLWFDNQLARFLPKGSLQVALVIHYFEAWLATLAILVWHIYGTVFRTAVSPMNPAWWSGRMPKQMYNKEHPEGPRLKARKPIERIEDETEVINERRAPDSSLPSAGRADPNVPTVPPERDDE
jgi:cytochrome b subunit of formate dehydrogenase